MNSYRCMRSILFFDLPTEKKSQRKAYSTFVKNLKKNGFVMMQESVYIKLDMDDRAAESTKEKIKKFLPNDGFVAMLRITEKQFSGIDFLVGYSETDVLSNDERVVEL